MKKYYIHYWSYKKDEWQDFETEITATTLEEAYSIFKDSHRLSKLTEIKLINN